MDTPLLGYGEEEVQGTSLQPFANLRGGGKTFHTGLDIGASLDGAGYYAAAAGVVRFIHSGSDMGTLMVVQHPLPGKRTVNAVYMHGGDVVFVEPGEKVVAGQLLGSMGESFSIENGGHYAHLHYGLYPGSFGETHNYGYRGVSAGLGDWYDPAHYLPVWIGNGGPLMTVPAGLPKSLDKAVGLLEQGKVAAAYAAAAGEDGAGLRTAIEQAVAGAMTRAEGIRARGYPGRALAFLQQQAKSCKGVPGGEELAAAAKAWKKDGVLKAAIKAEGRVLKTEAAAAKLAGSAAGVSEAQALWDALLKELADTCLVPRIEALRRGVDPR